MKPILQPLFMSPNVGEHWKSWNEMQTHDQSRAENADRREKSPRTSRRSRFLDGLIRRNCSQHDSQLCCQIVDARPGRRLECEHRFEQRPQAKRNVRCFELFDRQCVRSLTTVNFLNASTAERCFSCKREPKRYP